MGEVVQGPWGRDFFDSVSHDNTDLLNIVVESLTEELFDMIREEGFDNLDQIEYIKDLALISDSIRSYLMKLQERYYPLQDVAENFFSIEEDGTLSIEPKIDITFKEDHDLS